MYELSHTAPATVVLICPFCRSEWRHLEQSAAVALVVEFKDDLSGIEGDWRLVIFLSRQICIDEREDVLDFTVANDFTDKLKHPELHPVREPFKDAIVIDEMIKRSVFERFENGQIEERA